MAKMQLGNHIHIPENVRECEGMSPRTPKWNWSPYEVLNFQKAIGRVIVLNIYLYH
jgi:hypothetical protein